MPSMQSRAALRACPGNSRANRNVSLLGAIELSEHNVKQLIHFAEVPDYANDNPSISRRKFAQLLGVGAACAVAKPALSFATDPVTQPAAGSSASASIVRLSSNENPYGPSPQALKAMNDAFNPGLSIS